MFCLLLVLFASPFEHVGEFTLERESHLIMPANLFSNEHQLMVICEADDGLLFHLYSHQGKKLTSFARFGKGPEEIEVMGFPSWVPWEEVYCIYDLYGKTFKAWGDDGTFRDKKISLPNNVFLKKFGRLFPLPDKTFLVVLDNDEAKWHLAKCDRNLNFEKYGFPIEDPRVVNFNDTVHTLEVATFVEKGQTRVAVLENLTPLVHIFDANLKPVRRFPIMHPSWRDADLDELRRIQLRRPTAWRRGGFKDEYSEICAFHVIANELLVIGYRNLKPKLYTYQCFDLDGNKIGAPLETKLLLKGRIGARLLFLDEDADTVKLIEYRVARRATP